MVMPNACATPGWFVGSLVCGWWLVVVVFVGGMFSLGLLALEIIIMVYVYVIYMV